MEGIQAYSESQSEANQNQIQVFRHLIAQDRPRSAKKLAMTLNIAAGNHPVGTMHIGSPKGREHRALRAVFRAILSKTSKLISK